MRVREVVCSGWFGRWMHRRGWGAVTLPNLRKGVTIRYWQQRYSLVAFHELTVHVPQIVAMGGLRYLATYAWLWFAGCVRYRSMRKAYDNHPMERDDYLVH